jgi:hypothetical protein
MDAVFKLISSDTTKDTYAIIACRSQMGCLEKTEQAAKFIPPPF